MFGFLKKSEIVSMCEGTIFAIDKCIDDVFSQKMMGDGFIIKPTSKEIVSPIDGEVVMMFPTLHAIGLKDQKGNEYLIHVGIETVNLNGEGFKNFVSVNQKVSKGQKLLECDFDLIKDKIKATDVVLILTDGRKCHVIEEKKVNLAEENIVEIR